MRQIKITVIPRERLDKYLAKTNNFLTRSKAKKLINEGFILVNNEKVNPDYKLAREDKIKIEIPPPPPSKVAAEKIPLKMVYEDRDILIIDKSSGMVVHPTLDHPSGTLVNALLYYLKNITGVGETLRPGIVHRLDKGTSGLLVVAKNANALESLKKQFRDRTVSKKYLALVSRLVEPPVGKIEKPIFRHPKNRKKFTISLEGREAITHYKVIEKLGKSYTLLELEPKTGRTHQIRVHLSSLGYPIVGDKLYGGQSGPRLFLHASSLEFNHPRTGKRISFESKLPSDLLSILAKLKEVNKK